MKFFHAAFISFILLPFATFANAANDADIADLRCMIVVSGLMNSTDSRVQSLAGGALQYFFGRIDGRDPKLDIENGLSKQQEEMRKMTAEEQKAEKARCGSMLSAKGAILTEIGKHMTAQESSATANGK